jgi:signal transduction histidine kinase
MSAVPHQQHADVGRLAVRVAIRATLLVAVLYLIVAGAVAAYSTGSLTSQVDADLARTLDHFAHDGDAISDGPVVPPPDDRALGPQRALWVIGSNGSVMTDRPDLELPVEFHEVTTPVTATISGEDIRVAGMPVNTGYLVVGESLAPVNAARTTVILGEILIAPVLLLSVFAGSVLIGRRVAMPIERARQRQLDLTADASHELRTPLSVIEANASLALAPDADERDTDWYRRGFGRVDAEARRMRRMLEDLLWLARFDASAPPPAADPLDLATLARQTADRFAAVAEARSLHLTVDAGTAAALVAAPPDWLDRLVGVLLDNACKYAPAGGTVAVAVHEAGGRVSLTVDDSGPGIPDVERERIFDRFHRATDGEQGGAGLGLAIGDAIVRATGGKWSVGSSPAGGARMSVSWPRAGAGSSRENVDIVPRPRREPAKQ